MNRFEPYALLASVYDGGWSDYSKYIAELVESLESERHRPFRRICDAACGTGLLLAELLSGDAGPARAARGFDRSPEMLELAALNAPGASLAPGDLCEPFPFHGPFDLIACVYDSLNYLLDEEALASFFRHARAVADPRATLVCDLNDASMYADRDGVVQHRLIDGVAIREQFQWEVGPPGYATTTFHFPGGVEVHRQRAWDEDEVETALDVAGWKLVDSLDVMDHDVTPAVPSGKVVYIGVPQRG